MAQVAVWCSSQMTSPTTVPSVVAKDTVSAMVQLARESVESASDDLELGMASHPMASSRDVAHRFSLS